MSDEQLMERSAQDDEQAFGVLYTRHFEKTKGILARWVKDPDAVDDLAQTVWFKIWRARQQYRVRSKFSTWHYAIVRNEAMDHVTSARSRRMRNASDMARGYDWMELQEGTGDPSLLIEENDRRRYTHAAIARLPGNRRDLVEMIDIGGMEYEEAARMLDVPLGTIKSRLYRARQQLIKQLKDLDLY